MGSDTRLLTDREVATELRMGLTKIRRLIREGTIPSVQIDGHRRVRSTRLQEYLEGLEGEPRKPLRRTTIAMPSAAHAARHAAGEATRRRVVEYQAEHPDATKAEVAAALGVSKSTVMRYTAA
jgi:excisionase family DNA binding protein